MSEFMEEEITLRDFIRAFWRWKWWIMLTVSVVMAATAAVSLQMPKVYRSTALLVPPEVDQAWPTPDGLKTRFGAAAVGGAIRPNTTATDIIVGLLNSRRIAVTVIEKFDLRRVYPAEPGFKLPRMPWQEGNEGTRLSDIIEKLHNRTDVLVTREGMISISVEDLDPQRASDMAKAHLDELDRINTELQTTYNQYLARVVDWPVPADRKCKPRVILNTFIAGAAAMFVWMVLVFCRVNLMQPKQTVEPVKS